MPTTYRTQGFQRIVVEDDDDRHAIQTVDEAAGVFAERMARRLGKRGSVGALRLDTWTRDNTAFTFEAFIGRSQPDRSISGHNEWFTVTVDRT
jgi:hypothetical protein